MGTRTIVASRRAVEATIHSQKQLLDVHLPAIDRLNRLTGNQYVYWLAVNIEAHIRPIVALLNSPWTVTLNSCGGHFVQGPGFQYPYVHFAVLRHHKTAWSNIVRYVRAETRGFVTPRCTLVVQCTCALPAVGPSVFIWRFAPAPHVGDRHEFRTRREYEKVIYGFTDTMHNVLSRAMAREDHRHGRSER